MGGLPFTGTPADLVALVAISVIGVGALLILAGRRPLEGDTKPMDE